MASQVGVAGLLITISIGLFRDAYHILSEDSIDLARTTSAFLYPSASAIQNEASIEQHFADIRRRLADTPGVEQVSQSHSPLQEFIRAVVVSTRTASQYSVALKRIDRDYLEITGQALALGRNFSATEIQQAANVALVNSAFAALLDRDGGILGTELVRGEAHPYTVVGVVNDLAYPGVSADRPQLYLPASEAGSNFIIKFRPGQQMGREQFVRLLESMNSGLRVFLYDDLERQRADILLPRRITAVATLLVAAVVILVSAIGLYGMVRYTTRLIRTEIGARLAFGARSGHIMLMLLRSHLTAIAAGCAVSAMLVLLLAPGSSHWITQAIHVRWPDAALALAVLVLLAILACHLSLRSLLAQSPASVLRDPDT